METCKRGVLIIFGNLLLLLPLPTYAGKTPVWAEGVFWIFVFAGCVFIFSLAIIPWLPYRKVRNGNISNVGLTIPLCLVSLVLQFMLCHFFFDNWEFPLFIILGSGNLYILIKSIIIAKSGT